MTSSDHDGPPQVRVYGRVSRPKTWTTEDLESLPGGVEELGAIVAGFSGRAAPVGPLLAEVAPDATHGTVISDDGSYRASIPLSDLRHGWLAFGLPRSAGGPFRAVVPQGATLCWNVKSVAELKITDRPEPDNVPARPGH